MIYVFEVREQYQVSNRTLKQWADDGHLKCMVIPGGKRMYSLNALHTMFVRKYASQSDKAKVCYVQVNSQHQQHEDPNRRLPLARRFRRAWISLSKTCFGSNA
jgi:predicted site-specific integrase-resolvase